MDSGCLFEPRFLHATWWQLMPHMSIWTSATTKTWIKIWPSVADCNKITPWSVRWYRLPIAVWPLDWHGLLTLTLQKSQGMSQIHGLCMVPSVKLCHRVQRRPQLQLDHGHRHVLRQQQLSLGDILVPSGSTGHSDQHDSDGSMAAGHQKATGCSPDLRLHVTFGSTLGTWLSIQTTAVVETRAQTWSSAAA